MKRFLLLFLTFHLSLAQVFAVELFLDVEISQVQVWENFDITIDVNREQWEEVSIETIEWIENFTILWQSNQERYVDINGQVEVSTKLLFTLQPKTDGSFTIGPVHATSSWSNISSNTVDLQVWSTIVKPNVDEKPLEIQDIFEEIETKTDINWYPLLFLIFFIIFYFVIQNLLKKEPKKITQVVEKIDPNQLYIKRLKLLKQQSESFSKDLFYAEYASIIRGYIESLWYKNAWKMTLKEVQKLNISNSKVLQLFEKSYTNEFNEKEDTLSQRMSLIDDFIKELNT